jgi:homoserine kinase type II
MAVYTDVSFDEAAALVADLSLGTLRSLQPCAGGIENTNYFVDTDTGRYVLTLFERLGFDELPFYLGLMQHLAARGIPVPGPHADASGRILLDVKGKPAAMVDRLRGRHLMAPDASHCASVGTMLARMHQAAADFALVQPNLRGLAWWTETVPTLQPFLTAGQRALIDTELAFQQQLAATPAYAGLPRGAIHADLFRDNAMFEGDTLTGLFDFYFAGVDALLFDLAVCLNDWCLGLRRRLRRAAPAHRRRAAASARADARRRAALLGVAPVGPAPAARRPRAHRPRPRPLRACAARARGQPLAPRPHLTRCEAPAMTARPAPTAPLGHAGSIHTC